MSDQVPATARQTSTPTSLQARLTWPIRRALEKGAVPSAKLGFAILGSRVKRVRAPGRQYLLLSHTLDNSGAPLVLVEIAAELIEAHGPGRVRLLAPTVVAEQAERLRALGIEPEKAAVLGGTISRFQLAAAGADFVLVNTAAIHDDYQRVLLDRLASGRLEHAYWFFHENVGQLQGLGSRIVEADRLHGMSGLISSGRLTVLVPSVELKSQYDALFQTRDVRAIALRVVVDDRYCVSRPPSDYHSLSFSIVGDAMDGRKGQMLALDAFEKFMVNHFSDRPDDYRNFTLSLIGVRESENARELRRRGEALLGDRFKIFPRMVPEAVLELTASLNATVCCAEYEGFPLSVAEAMAMGHVLLRNNSGGSEEQLIDGVNGFAISNDASQFGAMIERLLNREATSDVHLQRMGAASQRRIEPYRRSTYLPQFDSV